MLAESTRQHQWQYTLTERARASTSHTVLLQCFVVHNVQAGSWACSIMATDRSDAKSKIQVHMYAWESPFDTLAAILTTSSRHAPLLSMSAPE